MSEFGKILQEARQRAGLTQLDVANRFAITRNAVANWENGSSKPNSRRIKPLAEMLNFNSDDLRIAIEEDDLKFVVDSVEETRERMKKLDEKLREYDKAEKRIKTAERLEGAPLPFSLDRIFPAVGMVLNKDLPLYSSAQGGPDGALVDTSSVADYVKRPQMLENVRPAFAVYVVGDSMEPAYEAGDMVLVNPTREAFAGQDAILMRILDDSTCSALVKRIVKKDDNYIEVLEYSPEKRTYRLDRSEWRYAFPIVGKYNRRW